MDPQILWGPGYETYLRRLDQCSYSPVDVLEINHFEGAEPVIKLGSADNNYLEKWLQQPFEMPVDQRGTEAVGGLCLMHFPPTSWNNSTTDTCKSLGPSTQHISSENLPAAFPRGMKDIHDRKPLPFSRHVLDLIVEKFHLPAVTPWVLLTKSSHFQAHTISNGYARTITGYTMRRSTRGILAMNISLSLSHDSSTGMTFGLLLGCSDIQQAFILEQIKVFAKLAINPLLLPVLFSAHQQQLLNRERKELWVSLLRLETESGQTGAPVINSQFFQKKSQDYGEITKRVLGVIQIASAWESYSKALALGIDSIQESLLALRDLNPEPRMGEFSASANVFKEWLRSIRHKSNVVLWDFEFINKRAQAQMTAVHSYIAQRDAQLSQKLSEHSTVLAADSREIAAASKRDSSAMKGIAFLTMIFLPGTYIATFFAMPFLDFSNSIPTSKPGFWIYWAVTAPLTTSVLAIYLTYLSRVSHKNREEDRRARAEIPLKKDAVIRQSTVKANYFEKLLNPFPRFLDVLPQSWFRKTTKDVQPNPELGMSNHTELARLSRGAKPTQALDNNIGGLAFQVLPTPGESPMHRNHGWKSIGNRPGIDSNGELPLERPQRITRRKAFQAQPTHISSHSDMEFDEGEIDDVAGGTSRFLPPESSRSRIRQARAPSITIDTTNTGQGFPIVSYDSEMDSDSSYGL